MSDQQQIDQDASKMARQLELLWLTHIKPWMQEEIDRQLGPLEARIQWHVEAFMARDAAPIVRSFIAKTVKDHLTIDVSVRHV